MASAVMTDSAGRTFMHECDHLNGVLYVDHVNIASNWMTQAEMDRLLQSVERQRLTNRLSNLVGSVRSFFPGGKKTSSN